MAASPLIPKEQLSAYERWELNSFDAPKQQPKADTAAQAAARAEQIRQIDAQARAEGYAAGHKEGVEAGRRESLAETAPRAARLDQMLATLTTDLASLDRELAAEVVQLGLAVARKLIGEAVRVHPEIVRQAVEEALRHVAHIRGPVTLVVNPEDAAIVRAHMEISPPSEGWTVREDAGTACGGCRVETPAGEADATLQARWHRITAALGQPHDWVE